MAILAGTLRVIFAASALFWDPLLRASAQLFDPLVLDFTYFGDVRTEIPLADVIKGFVKIRAPLPTEEIKTLEMYLADNLAGICPTRVRVICRVYQEVESFQQVQINLLGLYFILPITRDDLSCAKGLTQVENFQRLLSWRVSVDSVEGPGWNVETWRMELEPAEVQQRPILYPKRLPPPVLSPKPPGPLVYENENFGGYGSDSGNATGPNDPKCKFAGSACVCATTAQCAWTIYDGGYACIGIKSATNIDCQDCPLQDGCSQTQGQACQLLREPCTCATSANDCRWDLSTMSCIPANGATTTCSICSRQAHCDAPKVAKVNPGSGSKFGVNFARRVTVTFDRPVEFQQLSDGVQFHCRGQDRPQSISHSLVTVQEKVLTVNIVDVPSEEEALCNLTLSEGVVRDSAGIPFRGTKANWYIFRLADTVGPRIVKYAPENGAEDIAPGVATMLVFNEPVNPVPACSVTLFQRNIELTSFDLSSSDVVFDAERRRLTVAVGEHIQNGQTYSLRLPPGCIKDDANNEFDGLNEGVYIFHTQTETFEAPEEEEFFTQTMYYSVGGVAGLIILICCCVLICRMRRANQTLSDQLKEQVVRVRRWSVSSVDGVWTEASHAARRVRRFSIDAFAMTGESKTTPDDTIPVQSNSRRVHPELNTISGTRSTSSNTMAPPPVVMAQPPRSQPTVLLSTQSSRVGTPSSGMRPSPRSSPRPSPRPSPDWGAPHPAMLERHQTLPGPRVAADAGERKRPPSLIY